MTAPALQRWHAFTKSRDLAALEALLAEDAVFWSPVVHTPQRGRRMVMLYLAGAMHTLGNEHFRYLREIVAGNEACLEFETQIDGITINGVDLIRWDSQDRIVDFKVMVRPLKGLQKAHEVMGAALAKLGPKAG